MSKEVKKLIEEMEEIRDNPTFFVEDYGEMESMVTFEADECKTLLDYINQLENKLNKINTIVSNIDEKKIPKYQDKIRDLKFWLNYDYDKKVKCDREMSPEELEIHNIILSEIKKEGGSNE